MRPVIRVYLYDENGERFFGEGPLRLLHALPHRSDTVRLGLSALLRGQPALCCGSTRNACGCLPPGIRRSLRTPTRRRRCKTC